MDSIASSFKQFIIENGIISVSAGITVGFATATFVKSFVADVVMPLIFMVLVNVVGRVNSGASSFMSKFLAAKEFRFVNFVSELLTWILIIFAAYLILQLIVVKYLRNAPGAQVPQSNPFFAQPSALPTMMAPTTMSVSPSKADTSLPMIAPLAVPLGTGGAPVPHARINEEYNSVGVAAHDSHAHDSNEYASY